MIPASAYNQPWSFERSPFSGNKAGNCQFGLTSWMDHDLIISGALLVQIADEEVGVESVSLVRTAFRSSRPRGHPEAGWPLRDQVEAMTFLSLRSKGT